MGPATCEAILSFFSTGGRSTTAASPADADVDAADEPPPPPPGFLSFPSRASSTGKDGWFRRSKMAWWR